MFRGDYYAHGKQFMVDLPIRRIDFCNQEDARLHNAVTRMVREINDLVMKRHACEKREDKTLYDRVIAASERSLEQMMNTLYEVDATFERAARQ